MSSHRGVGSVSATGPLAELFAERNTPFGNDDNVMNPDIDINSVQQEVHESVTVNAAVAEAKANTSPARAMSKTTAGRHGSGARVQG